MSQQNLFSSVFRERLRLALKGRDQAAVAAECGLSQPTISRWLNGVTEPKLVDAASVAHALGTTVGEMLGELPCEPKPGVTRAHLLAAKLEINREINRVLDELAKKF